jgi:multimeric flavodoxin WrbA
MKIAVLNGSPKRETSVTMQYVRYLQAVFPHHDLQIVHVAPRINALERNAEAFQEVIDQVREADGVLWAFPLYYLLVHGNYKRFIELIWERDVADAFAGKHAAALSTSIHYFDHTAHNYIHAISDDLGMRFVGSFSADMQDLFDAAQRATLTAFGEHFFEAIAQDLAMPRRYASIVPTEALAYTPGPVAHPVSLGRKRVVVVTDSVTDARPQQTNLIHMVERFAAAFTDGEVEVVNLHDVDIKGGCQGCVQCGYDNQCVYQGKDGYVDFYNTKLKPADILVFAGAIRDRYLSSTWKTFFDRSFFNGHAPSLPGKQFGFIITGPLVQLPNLRQILEAWVQMQRANLVDFVTDEVMDASELDAQLQGLAQRLVWCADQDYVPPQTFLGVGGYKLFRDDIWGRLRIAFLADHRAYKRLGVYDFPQKNLVFRVLNTVVPPLLRIRKVRETFMARLRKGVTQPYQRVIASVDSEDA